MTVKTKTTRNQAMECFKMLAAVLVVFIHVTFPGRAGSLVVSLARIGVPVFFAISGYFSFQVHSDRLGKRILHIGGLFVTAVAAAVILGSITAVANGQGLMDFLWGYVPGTENLATMMLLQESSFPHTGYTWYLLSVLVCYGVLFLYAGFFGEAPIRYQPLYIVSVFLLVIHTLMGEMTKAANITVPYQLYRNGLFFGLPMFTLGIFIREYQERILTNFRLTDKKLMAVILIGVTMTLLQWKGVGVGELPPGAVVQAVGWMLLLASHPDLKRKSKAANAVIGSLGMVSTVVYLIHYPLIDIYETFLLPYLPLDGMLEAWLKPVFIAVMSIAVGILWVGIRKAVKRK